MSERIKQLAEQAEILITEVGAFHNTPHGAYQLQEQHIKKFAELLVRECIETMRLVPYESDREFGDEIIYQEAVKKHFGVEE